MLSIWDCQASDGIWDFISSQEAIDMVAKAKTVEEACKHLCDEARRRWICQYEASDDITCIVIELKCDGEESASESSSASSAPRYSKRIRALGLNNGRR